MKRVVAISAMLAVTTTVPALGSVPSQNAKMFNPGAYVGAQAGFADTNYQKSWLTDSPNITAVGSVDKSGFSGRIFTGYNFTPYVAFEMGYLFLPRVKFNSITVAGFSTTVNEGFSQGIFDAVIKGTLPLPAGYDLYAKGGYAAVNRGDVEVSSGGTTVTFDTSDTKHVPVIGVGASYHVTKNVVADVSYAHYFDNGDLEATNFGSAGLIYQFG